MTNDNIEAGSMEDDQNVKDDEREEEDTSGESLTLREVASRACKRIDVGAAVLPKPLFAPDVEDYDGSEELQDAAASVSTHYSRILQNEFNAVVVEHHLKWAPLLQASEHQQPPSSSANSADNASLISASDRRFGRYDFYHADSIVDWALERKMKVKGHVLVWAVTSPKWLEDLEADQVREELRRHIFTVMGHFRGRIAIWDVVNEALAPDGSLAENVFFRKLGPSYIEDSFRWAHEADPKAILLYNDNKVEGIGSKKAQAFYELLADLKAKDVPIHGCGMQAHFNAAGVGLNRCPTPRMVKEQIRRLGELGLTVNLSEMDVRVSKLPANLRQVAQNQIFHDILAAALSEPAFDGVWLWGFSDRHTWVTHFYYDDEPLIFDEDYGRKQAYYGLRDALKSLTPGYRVGGEGVVLFDDVDVNGKPWGHLWMVPETEEWATTGENKSGGDSRPDWEQEVPEHSNVVGTDAESGDDRSGAMDLAEDDRDLPEIS